MPKPKIRFRVIRTRPTIASPPEKKKAEPLHDIPPLSAAGMELLSAEALPLQGKRIDKDMHIYYSPATIHGKMATLSKKDMTHDEGDHFSILESGGKIYCMTLRQGSDEIIITAEAMATFAVIAKKFFDDVYVKIQVDRAAIQPLAELDFSMEGGGSDED